MKNKFFKFVLVTGILVFSIPCLTQAQTWSQLSTGPFGRVGHSAVYDSANNIMIVFGGEYWYLTGIGDIREILSDSDDVSNANGLGGIVTVSQLSTTGPAGRYYHSAVYDNINNRMIVFGGSRYGLPLQDTWVLLNANGLGGPSIWTTQSLTSSIPTSRYNHSTVYDTTSNRMIIYGGIGAGNSLSDLWVMDNANGIGQQSWTQLTASGDNTTSRYQHVAVYDNANNRMIVYGGIYYATTSSLNETWVLNNANGISGTPSWTRLTTIGNTPPASGGQAVYDTARNRMYIYMGDSSANIWILSNANGLGGTPTWTTITTTGEPPPSRYGFTIVYDPTSNRIILYGGDSDYTDYNDVWALDMTGVTPVKNWMFY